MQKEYKSLGMVDLYAHALDSHILLDISDSHHEEGGIQLELTEKEAFRVALMLESMAMQMQLKRRSDGTLDAVRKSL